VTFVRFPHTPHLAWLGEGRPRADKVLTPAEARELLRHEVTIEEKVDGANVGFSVDDEGAVRVQSRGADVQREACHPQFRPLFPWLEPRRQALGAALSEGLILFGEWCYAVHSVRYTRLPDWLLAFDVFDRRAGSFWSVPRRDALAKELGLAVVPQVTAGRFDLDGLIRLLGQSKLGSGPTEGLYVRRDEGDWLAARAKLVRAEFVQNIDVHWSRRPMRTNQLASNGDRNRPRDASAGR
jgi:hypothetical protein